MSHPLGLEPDQINPDLDENDQEPDEPQEAFEPMSIEDLLKHLETNGHVPPLTHI